MIQPLSAQGQHEEAADKSQYLTPLEQADEVLLNAVFARDPYFSRISLTVLKLAGISPRFAAEAEQDIASLSQESAIPAVDKDKFILDLYKGIKGDRALDQIVCAAGLIKLEISPAAWPSEAVPGLMKLFDPNPHWSQLEPIAAALSAALRDRGLKKTDWLHEEAYALSCISELARGWSPEQRREAAERLTALPSAVLTKALESSVNDGFSQVQHRPSLCMMFANCPPEIKYLTPGLIRALADKEPDVRAEAAWLLKLIGKEAREAAAALEKSLQDADPAVRAAAAAALGRIRPSASAADLDRLKKLLGDADEGVRGQAAEALINAAGGGRRDQFTWLLQEALKEKKIDADIVIELVKTTDGEGAATIKALQHADASVRTAVACYLARNCADDERVLTTLIKSLGDKSEQVRECAEEGLFWCGWTDKHTERVILALANAFQTGAVSWSRLKDFGEIKGDTALALTGFLSVPDPSVRKKAAELLGNGVRGEQRPAQEGKVVKALTERLELDENDGVRAAAAEALGRIGAGAAPALPALFDAAKNGGDLLSSSALLALAQVDGSGTSVLPFLISELSSNRGRCYAAARAIGVLGPKAAEAVPGLIGTLGRDQCLPAALQALGSIGPAAAGALPTLKQMEKHESVPVRAAVIRAILLIAPTSDRAELLLADLLTSASLERQGREFLQAMKAAGPAANALAPTMIKAAAVIEGTRIRGELVQSLLKVAPHDADTLNFLVSEIAQPSDEKAAMTASFHLRMLGPAARDVLPELQGLSSREPAKRKMVNAVIAAIDPQAELLAPPLAPADHVQRLWDRDAAKRQEAVAQLRILNPEELVQVLESSAQFRKSIEYAQVREYPREAQPLIPQISKAAVSIDAEVRRQAAAALGRYRAFAAEALPLLRSLALQDPDQRVRTEAGEAIELIESAGVR